MPAQEDNGAADWQARAQVALVPVVNSLRETMKARFPTLPEDVLRDILCEELAETVHVLLSRKDMTVERCHDALGRVAQRCVERASSVRPERRSS